MARFNRKAFKCTPKAMHHVKQILGRRRHRLVAVFDMDGTLCSKTGTRLPACSLLRWMAHQGAAIDIITARPADGRRETVAWLATAGLLPAISVLRMPSSRLPSTAAITAWKQEARQRTRAAHGRLDVAVGDNVHDVIPVPVTTTSIPLVIENATGSVGLVLPTQQS